MQDTVQTFEKSNDHTRAGWVICGLAAIFYCYEYLLRIEPSVMVPELMQYFQVQATALGTLSAMYYLAYTPMQAVVGIVTDMYGPRRVLTLAVILCALGSLIFGNTASIYIASIGRFMMGFGSAFAFVGVLKLASIWLPLNRFAFFTGLATALGMAGAMVGNILMAKLVQQISWQPTLLIGTIAGFILTPIMWLVIRDNKPEPEEFRNARVVEKLSYRETGKELLQMVKNSQMWICGLIGTMQYLSLSLFAEFWGIPFIQARYGLTPTLAALANSMIFFGWLVGAPLAGWISDRLRLRKLPLFVGSLGAGLLVLIVLYLPNVPLIVLCILLFLFGLFCSVEIICFAIGRELNDIKMSATSVAFINMIIMLGGLISQPAVGMLLDWSWLAAPVLENGNRLYSAANYQWALLVLPAGLFLSALLTKFLHESFQDHAE